VTLTAATGATVEVIVVNAGQRLSAYRNECAHEALPLNNAVLDLGSNTLTCPWHGFCYDATSGSARARPAPSWSSCRCGRRRDVWIRVTA
jgi:nitrite reductase/ring-hydroxylating ferredoxin subunit